VAAEDLQSTGSLFATCGSPPEFHDLSLAGFASSEGEASIASDDGFDNRPLHATDERGDSDLLRLRRLAERRKAQPRGPGSGVPERSTTSPQVAFHLTSGLDRFEPVVLVLDQERKLLFQSLTVTDLFRPPREV